MTYIANPNGGCVPQIKYEGIPRYPTVKKEDYKGTGGSFPNIRIARQIKYTGKSQKKEDKSKPKPKPTPTPNPCLRIHCHRLGGNFARQIKYAGKSQKKEDKSKPKPKPKPNSGPIPDYSGSEIPIPV